MPRSPLYWYKPLNPLPEYMKCNGTKCEMCDAIGFERVKLWWEISNEIKWMNEWTSFSHRSMVEMFNVQQTRNITQWHGKKKTNSMRLTFNIVRPNISYQDSHQPATFPFIHDQWIAAYVYISLMLFSPQFYFYFHFSVQWNMLWYMIQHYILWSSAFRHSHIILLDRFGSMFNVHFNTSTKWYRRV